LSGVLPRLADGLARLSARYAPDAVAAILTLVALALGLGVGGATPAQCALLALGVYCALVVGALLLAA
jgi:hypothetical protein